MKGSATVLTVGANKNDSADGLGSTMAVVDSSGNSQKSYQYDVYGEVTGGSGSLANEFDFAGQQTDATGLHYLRARYYDPETGTFLSREPFSGFPQWEANGAAYARGNPTRLVDPSGLMAVDADGGGVNHCRHECTVDFKFHGPAWSDKSGYLDINLTFGLGLVATVGVQIEGWNFKDDLHFYFGGGFGTPGVTVTIAPGQSPTDGLSCQASATEPMLGPVGPTAQLGAGGANFPGDEKSNQSRTDLDTPFVEVGVGTVGVSGTCTAIFTAGDLWNRVSWITP